MINPRSRKDLPFWLILSLLLAILVPAEAAQVAEAQPDTSRGAGEASRSNLPIKKPAWMWTLDERLAARFDTESMAAREAENKAKVEAILKRQGIVRVPESEAEITESPPFKETISGKDTPELFLPTELFDVLLQQASLAANNQAARDWIEAEAAALGCGDEFLDRLGETSAPYRKLLYKDNPQDQSVGRTEEENLHLCRERVQALEAAEAEFGEEAFLRLLYEVMAPGFQMGRTARRPPGFPSLAEELRFREAGCR